MKHLAGALYNSGTRAENGLPLLQPSQNVQSDQMFLNNGLEQDKKTTVGSLNNGLRICSQLHHLMKLYGTCMSVMGSQVSISFDITDIKHI